MDGKSLGQNMAEHAMQSIRIDAATTFAAIALSEVNAQVGRIRELWDSQIAALADNGNSAGGLLLRLQIKQQRPHLLSLFRTVAPDDPEVTAEVDRIIEDALARVDEAARQSLPAPGGKPRGRKQQLLPAAAES